jgi:hypothetical protein
MNAYFILRKIWIKAHPYCEMVTENGTPCCLKRTAHIHHKKGRGGSLLCDERYFMALCAEHHRFVHDNMKLARKMGLVLF